MIYLCDNQVLLKAVMRWVGEGGKATLVRRNFTGSNRKAPKKEQQQKQRRFWSKLKRIEEKLQMKKPTCKQTKAILSKDVSTEWCDRINRAVFSDMARASPEESKVSYEDRKSMLDSGVWKAIRRGSAEEEVRKHRDRVIGA